MAKIAPEKYHNDAPTCPGKTILEVIESMNMVQTSLARRMGRPVSVINEIIKGKKTIIASTAIELERVLGLPAKFWLQLEQNYQEAKARIAEEVKIQGELKQVGNFPYAEMVTMGLVAPTRIVREKYKNLLSFLKVASLAAMEEQNGHRRCDVRDTY